MFTEYGPTPPLFMTKNTFENQENPKGVYKGHVILQVWESINLKKGVFLTVLTF